MNTVAKSYIVNSILHMMAMSHYIFNKLYIAVSNYCIIFSLKLLKSSILLKAISLTVIKQFGNILKSGSRFPSILIPLHVNLCNDLVNTWLYLWHNGSTQWPFQQYFCKDWKVINTSLYYQKHIATLVYITASVSLLFHKHSCNNSTSSL